MGMTTWLRMGIATLSCGILSACAVAGTTEGDDCVSHYESIGNAPTWAGLQTAMLEHDGWWGPVVSARTQSRGDDAGVGEQGQDLERVIDLLNRKGGRAIQAHVWRADSGAWRAGVWHQCTD